MTAHKHAASMLLYAQDAAEEGYPWTLWQTCHGGLKWSNLETHPTWLSYAEYRRKAKTIRIGEFDVPEPLRHAPALGTEVYWPIVHLEGLYNGNNWQSEGWQKNLLLKGMLHLTVEAAELHAKALISLTKVAA